IERRQSVFRWSAVFAGATVAIGLWVLLQTLGMGIGLVSSDLDSKSALHNLASSAAIWTFIAPLIALFIGGVVAGRLGTTRERATGSLHGLVVWALTSAFGLVLGLGIITVLALGAMRAGNLTIDTNVGPPDTSEGDQDALGALLGPIDQQLH